MNKWHSLAFLCGIFFVYTVDRALLGLLAIPIQNETGVSDQQFGILNSVVFWTYAAAVPFAGLVGDRHDKRTVIGIAVLAWSVMTVLAGFASGFWSLLALVSVAITLPQAFYGPSANALVAKEHVGTRAVALIGKGGETIRGICETTAAASSSRAARRCARPTPPRSRRNAARRKAEPSPGAHGPGACCQNGVCSEPF